MTSVRHLRFGRGRRLGPYLLFCLLAGCATPSGLPAQRILQPDIAAAYLPLNRSFNFGLTRAAGAAVVIAPGIAVTNAHNANLLDPKDVIATARDYDLLFFRTGAGRAPPTAEPLPGMAVTAYGQDTHGALRLATGTVRAITLCEGCSAPAYFTFAGDAGPGFSGGPVVDGAGRLLGITFGYKDEGGERLIYAYDVSRVRAELAAARTAVRRP